VYSNMRRWPCIHWAMWWRKFKWLWWLFFNLWSRDLMELLHTYIMHTYFWRWHSSWKWRMWWRKSLKWRRMFRPKFFRIWMDLFWNSIIMRWNLWRWKHNRNRKMWWWKPFEWRWVWRNLHYRRRMGVPRLQTNLWRWTNQRFRNVWWQRIVNMQLTVHWMKGS